MLPNLAGVAIAVLLTTQAIAGWRVSRTAQLVRRRGGPSRLFESEPRTDYSFGKGMRKVQKGADSSGADSSKVGSVEPIQAPYEAASFKASEPRMEPSQEKPKAAVVESVVTSSEESPVKAMEASVEPSQEKPKAEVVESVMTSSEESPVKAMEASVDPSSVRDNVVKETPPTSVETIGATAPSVSSFGRDKGFSLDAFCGIMVERVSDGVKLDLGTHLASFDKALVVFGTYAADFNCIEYAQRVRHYLPSLKDNGVNKVIMIINGAPSAAKKLAELVELQTEVELLSDPLASAGRAFGVSRGWIPEEDISPYLKLFGMLWGLGAWATLPSVIGGYIGNPWGKQPWIQSALQQGQLAGRWPNSALVLDENGAIKENKFDSLKYVGGWGRRPLELATLRLQNMIGVSLRNWADLKPSDESLTAGVLTQLGGCVVIAEGEKVQYIWRDQGICHVANFEAILKKLSA